MTLVIARNEKIELIHFDKEQGVFALINYNGASNEHLETEKTN
jgi:hypothetical protein